ncbi:MAG: colanic acid biosynthesis glycosyltransferase WcaL [Verrucomicrobiaceae bacterium]|nr:colanic acid biosynthesis glycosyltransferase WcaL [Verrucomicrobiaceae bacterium]
MFVAGHPSQPHEFINGVEVEEQWLKNDRWRNSLEALRTELASAVDGEVFLRGARRAVWMANRAQTGMPTLIHGAGLTESLAAWLAGKLLNVPFSACIGAGEDLRWTSKLVNQIKAEARCFVTVTPSPSA